MDETKVDNLEGIPEFFKGKTVFMTGATGTVGKLLVEKLLYSCPQIVKIYILVRPKKGQSPLERTQQLFTSRAFMRLNEKYPGVLESKVVPLAGDTMEEKLGLSLEDEELLRREVNVILHCAATVRFDDPLKLCLDVNTLSTMRLCDLALTWPNLMCFTHISTAYTNCDSLHIKEELGPPKADWRKTLMINKETNPATLEILCSKYIDKLPNTYTFSKSLAEHIINDYKDQLPVVIVRPSIVMAALKEPVPGWSDNRYGPIGICIGLILGILRCLYVSPKSRLNNIPSDDVVNATIVATWKNSLERENKEERRKLPMYNLCTPLCYTSDLRQLIAHYYTDDEVIKHIKKDGLFYIFYTICGSLFFFRINNLFRHLISAYFIDLIITLNGKPPMLVKLRRKLFIGMMNIAYFSHKTFTFETPNFDALIDDLNLKDKETFGWNFNQGNVFNQGVDQYEQMKFTTLKPLYDDLENNRKYLRMLYIVDRSAVYLTYSLIGLFLYLSSLPFLLLSTAVKLVTFP